MVQTSPVVHLVDAMESVVLAESFLDKGVFAMEHTIDDYPISFSLRGQCKLGVESNRRGVRSVKTTTDKRGRWCAPKASVYRDGRTTKMFVLACHSDVKCPGWITLCVEGGYSGGVQLCHANNDTIRIAGCPFASTPQRCGGPTPFMPPAVRLNTRSRYQRIAPR